MSLFKKPKKSIRQRVVVNSDEENEVRNDVDALKVDNDDSIDGIDSNDNPKDIKQEKKKKRKQKERAVVSFVDEEEEVEAFQVKKSSQSRRLAKQIEKDKRRKEMLQKEVSNGSSTMEVKEEPASPPGAAPPPPLEPKSEPKSEPILSGRAAEMAGYHSSDDEKPAVARRPAHRFTSRATSLQHVLRDGVIPDAATIHAVRKRREQARRQQEMAADFVPIAEEGAGSTGARPAREDDDSGPEEDRVTFTVSTAARDREARRDQFNAARHQEDERASGDDDKELARWENQQFKKAFSGPQLTSVTAEHYLLPTDADEEAATRLEPLGRRQRRPLADLVPDVVRQRLVQKLSELRQTQSGHQTARDRVLDDLVTGQSEIDRLEREAPRAARRYQYYQDIRGYVTDLIECFDEKTAMMEQLEGRMIEVFRARSQKLVLRRRADIRDQRMELDSSTQRGGVHYSEQSADEVASRRRRATEREGRRTRRRRARELSASGGADHQDGLSSDDETAPVDADQFQKDRDAVLLGVDEVLADVEDDFSAIAGVCRHFAEWRRIDAQAYRDAYVSLSLPRALVPLVRLQMLAWNPLSDGESPQLESYPWFAQLVTFGATGDAAAETEETLRSDPDCLLVSRVLERVVLPKLTVLVERVWDPLSNSQTLRLVHVVRQLVRDFPTVNGESGLLRKLLQSVVSTFTTTVKDDVFVPRFNKQVLESRSTPAAAFFYRQFTSCVKLLGNMLSWTEVVSDQCLQQLALGTLLNDTMMLPLTQVPDPAEAVNKCRLVASALPRDWFHGEQLAPQLKMFVSYLTMLAVQVNKTSNKTVLLKSIVAILKKVGAIDAHNKISTMLE